MNKNDVFNVIISKANSIKNTNNVFTMEDYIDYRGAGLNSLELLELIIFIENYFGVEFDDEQLLLYKYVKLSDIVNLISYILEI